MQKLLFQLNGLIVIVCVAGLFLPTVTQAQIMYDESPVLEQQITSVNEVALIVDNYGVLTHDHTIKNSAAVWPNSATNPGVYLYAAGIWFGAKVKTEDGIRKQVFKTYDPDGHRAMATPGEFGNSRSDNATELLNSRQTMHVSTHYDADGQVYQNFRGQAPTAVWPLWKLENSESQDRYFRSGTYFNDPQLQSLQSQNAHPQFVSDQDIICRYHSGGAPAHSAKHMHAEHLSLQFEQAVYAWEHASMQNFVLLRHNITNVGEHTLYDCHFAHAGQIDIGDALNIRMIPHEDRMANYSELSDLNMAVYWSEQGLDVAESDYGYFAVSMLQSPLVDAEGFVVQNHNPANPANREAQIGLQTVRDWSDNSPEGIQEAYDYMSAAVLENGEKPAMRRMLCGSAAFNLRPGQSAQFVVGYFFAPSVSGIPNGDLDDISYLIEEVEKGHDAWYDNAAAYEQLHASAQPSLQISPNPVSDYVYLHLSDLALTADAQLEIYDLAGRQILTQILTSEELLVGLVEISVGSLQAGNYTCRVVMDELAYTAPFVIIR